jgi:hypothetical protein
MYDSFFNYNNTLEIQKTLPKRACDATNNLIEDSLKFKMSPTKSKKQFPSPEFQEQS